MWTVVLFDLPTETKKQRRNYALFRKALLKAGFTRFQFSVYIRHALSRDHMLVHHRRVRSVLPPQGRVSILQLTDKQFGMIQVFEGDKATDAPEPTEQLYIFEPPQILAAEPDALWNLATILQEVPETNAGETEELPLGSLLASAEDDRHLQPTPPQDSKRARKKADDSDQRQLFIF